MLYAVIVYYGFVIGITNGTMIVGFVEGKLTCSYNFYSCFTFYGLKYCWLVGSNTTYYVGIFYVNYRGLVYSDVAGMNTASWPL